MRYMLALVLVVSLAAVALAQDPPGPTFENMTPNKWHMLHKQKRADAVRFQRQEHGGSCFDSKRGRIVLFGSNTHGQDWTNSPLFFDVAKREWSRAYPNDRVATYKVNAEGLPVAGEKGDHPWAMHTFGCVLYDPNRDEMVIASWPQHMVPGRFSDALEHLWGKVKRHPTWVYSFEKKKWTALPAKAVHFFPFAAAFASDRKSVIGYGGGRICELSGEPRTWKRLSGRPLFGWHNNAAYDSKHKAVIVFGTNQNSNDIVIYKPASEEHRKMPTPGVRPPKDQHNPMCFDTESGMTVVVVDRVMGTPRKRQAETWLYDLGKDAWTQLPEATLPFGCEMNYNMEYDPNNNVCLLVATTRPGRATTVYALKVDHSKLKEKGATRRPSFAGSAGIGESPDSVARYGKNGPKIKATRAWAGLPVSVWPAAFAGNVKFTPPPMEVRCIIGS